MSRILLAIIIASFAAGAGLGALVRGVGRGPAPTIVVADVRAVGGPFVLTDHTGRQVTQADYSGRLLLLTFGTLRSRDTTPALLQVMGEALAALGSRAERVTPLFVTLDPEHDAPARLAEHLRRVHPRLVGLTGPLDEIDRLARAYRIPFTRRTTGGDPSISPVDHTPLLLLMGTDGRLLHLFRYGVAPAEIAAALAAHM